MWTGLIVYIVFHNKRHLKDMSASEVEVFLTYFAVQRKVAASTQNQALSTLVFLCRHVLHQDIDSHIDTVRAKQSRYLPNMLTHEEAIAILNQISGTCKGSLKFFTAADYGYLKLCN
jgi:site-specific recombinase XerD